MAGKLCFLVLMNSPRKGAGRPTVLLDMRPVQGPSGGRGVGAYARGLLGGLIRAGFDSHMTLLLDVAFDEPPLPPGGYRLAGCRRRSHGHLAAYEDAVALTADIQRIDPDVYHAIDFHLPGRSPRPMVVTLHDLIPWAWGGPRMRGERLRYMAAFRLLRRADAVIAVSQATAEDAARLRVAARPRVRVISEAADSVFAPKDGAVERVRSRWGIDGLYLLFVGALDARKDPHALLDAWNAARSSLPGVQLVLVGDPGRQAPPNMPGAVQVGRVDDGSLADLYSAAGCLVFPSRYEGFGLPCLEAMACGCPVAAFRNSSLPEVMGEAGMLVEDGDGNALGMAAAAMVGQRERWSRAGLQRSRRFSWDKTAQETIAVYESLIKA
ncbi:MAG TPA: glycosyltransferase family 1 protein [Candidatus Dormibacteraeota bacterium]|nr:glycosyltransferase family 1 protein [Candidatus Dormibacteraeota bacterium]